MIIISCLHNNVIYIILLLLGLISVGLRTWYLELKQKSGKGKARKCQYIYSNVMNLYSETLIDGTIAEIAPSVSKTLGYEQQELIGRNIDIIYKDPMLRKQILCRLQSENSIDNVEFEAIRKDGTACILLVNFTLLHTRNKTSRIIGIGKDVTEYVQAKKKQAELQEELEARQRELTERLEAIFESTEDMIYSIDRDYCILNCNSPLRDYMQRNYQADIEQGHCILEYMPEKEARKWKAFYDTALEKTRFNFECYIEHENRYIEVCFNAIFHNGEICGTAVFTKDITKKKEVEQQLIVGNQNLEQLVEERTAELRNTLSELEAFTYTVSHDLKAPLRAIEGYSRIILEDYQDTLVQDAKLMIASITRVSSDSLNLIDRVLQYSTTTKAGLQKENVDIGEIFSSVFKEVYAACPERSICFYLEEAMPVVFADPILIRQLIYNLLSNAVKFTKNRESARISAGCTVREKEWIFYIEDNGAGFNMKYAKKLFTMFQRLHDKEEFEGCGIGLATVYKIIQKHKGRTWIESELNQGTKVFFTLPME